MSRRRIYTLGALIGFVAGALIGYAYNICDDGGGFGHCLLQSPFHDYVYPGLVFLALAILLLGAIDLGIELWKRMGVVGVVAVIGAAATGAWFGITQRFRETPGNPISRTFAIEPDVYFGFVLSILAAVVVGLIFLVSSLVVSRLRSSRSADPS